MVASVIILSLTLWKAFAKDASDQVLTPMVRCQSLTPNSNQHQMSPKHCDINGFFF